MKWLKKDSSEDDQKTIAESQPEPEQTIEQVDIDGSKPEALEQPVDAEIENSATDSFESDEPIPAPPEEESIEEIQEETPEDFPEEESSEYMPDAFEIQDTDTVEDEAETLQPAEKPQRSGRRRRDRLEKEESSVEQKKPGFNPLTTFARTWIGKNWKTMAILMFIFCMALFVRSYYGIVPATEDGFILSGGSDSYYHNFVVFNSQDTGDFHFWDDMLNYPVGTRNPRPPLYDMSVTLGGIGASPLFDGDMFTATNWVFLFSTAFWGALTIFPTYFLAKEAFGKRTGIIAAFLLATMPGHIQRSVLTNADHDAMALFFIVTTFFFFLKALKVMEQKEWVSTWRKPKEAIDGIKNMVMSNKVSLLYAVMAGLSLAGVALIWKGYAYVIVIMSVYLLIQLLFNRFRNKDSLGLTSTYFVAVGTGLIIAFPYYYQSIQIISWFDTPALVWLGASVFAMLLVVTRKFPWVMVFSGMIGFGLVFLLVLAMVAPSFMDSLSSAVLSGAGYFIQNKQYQTIAEAQAPPFSNLAMSFGIITFWLSFVGIAWAAIQLPKSWKSDFTFIFIWSATSIYMAVIAARFMFNAGPAFAITAGWIIAIILSKLDMKKFVDNMRRAAQPHMSTQFKMGMLFSAAMLIVMSLVLYTFSGVAYPVFVIGMTAIVGIYMLNLIAETNPNRTYNLIAVLIPAIGIMFYILAQFYTDWEFSSATHVFILFVLLFSYFVLYMTVRRNKFSFTAGIIFLAFFIIMPNVWGGLDAGIPFEKKNDYDLEIYQATPTFMQPPTYDAINGSNWYLGGFGYSLPLNSRYWPAAYDWLATQDTEIYPPSERPAFLSWWDYGFEIVNEGKHPTVADNFLGGHQLAGNFIMSQSEADAIALLCARLIEGDWLETRDLGDTGLDDEVVEIIEKYGISVSMMDEYLVNPGNYVDEILAHPDKYGPRDDIIQAANARYILIRTLITEQLDEEGVVNLYSDLSEATGDSIRYFGIDSRLFPFSAENTGIFYAPAKLSDHRIDEVGNQPYDFWEIKAVGEFGGEYSLDDIPMDVRLNQDSPYKIVYSDMFYNSMLYKCFIGYSASDTMREDAEGIPGLSGTLAQDPIMPGWNMTHFKLEHRTAYWNPYGAEEIQDHGDAWQAMNYWDAYELQQQGIGISDLSDRSSMYQGTMMLKYYDGAIISGKVTLEDGTPLESVSVTVSDNFGIPHQRVVTDSDGSYSIIAPYGDITLEASTGPIDPLGMAGTQVNVTEMHIEDYQAMREDEDRDSNGKPDYLIDLDIIVESGSLNGVVFWDIDQDENFSEVDEVIPYPDLTFWNLNLAYSLETNGNETGGYVVDILPPGDYSVDISIAGRSLGQKEITVTSGAERQELLSISPSPLSGTVTFQDDGVPVNQAKINIWNPEFGLAYVSESDITGNYTFENIPYGEYFGQAVIEPYASPIMRLEIVGTENNTHDFELVYSSMINGTLTLPDGKPAAHTILRFSGLNETIIYTNDLGQYSAVLSTGIYDIYAEYSSGSDVYVVMDRVLLENNIEYDMKLSLGTMVNGKITDQDGQPGMNVLVLFEELATGFSTKAFTNNLGVYTTKILQGDYLIQVYSEDDLTQYTTRTFSTSSEVLDISTIEGTLISGTIFWDQDEDNVVSNIEMLDNAKISFTDPSGLVARATTNERGAFTIALYPSTPYSVTINKVGFESASLGTFTPGELSGGITQKLTPIRVPVGGTLFLDNEPLIDQNIKVSFVATTNGAETEEFQVGRDGTYSGNLIPGIYTLTFKHNITAGDDSQVYQIKEEFDLDTGLYIGATIGLDIDTMLRQRVSVSVISPEPMDFNASFWNGPDNRRFSVQDGTETYYVMPGNYVLSAMNAENETYWVGMKDVTVSNISNSFFISVEEGNKVTGKVTFNGSFVPNQYIDFKDSESNGSIASEIDGAGNFDIVLAPTNTYQAIIDYVEYDDSLNAYHYYLNKTIFSASTTQPLALTLEREEYYTNVSGALSNGAAGVDIIFYSLDDNFTVATNSLGQYDISLRPGVYTVYIHDQFSDKVHLDIIVIDLDTEIIDFEMVNGYRVSGTVYYDLNQNEVTELTVLFNISMVPVITDANGYYDIWLPSGEYSIAGSLNALKDSVSILYQLDNDFEIIDRDKQMNLPMAMIEERSVVISFDQEQLIETRDNVTVIYDFIVLNTGNIRDTYDLRVSGGNPEWTFELSVNELTLDPGRDNYAKVWVTVGIPEESKIDQNNINLVATSRNDPNATYNTIMSVDIRQQYSIIIEPVATSPTFADGIINSEFAVYNKGNGGDMYTLYIGNLDDLATSGWKAELGQVDGAELLNDNTRILNVSIVSGGVSNIPIILTPIDDNPARQASVLITGFSQIDGYAITSHHIIMKYPELQIFSDNVTVIGDEVSTIAVGEEVTNAGVMVVSVVVALGLFYYARKKRWIR